MIDNDGLRTEIGIGIPNGHYIWRLIIERKSFRTSGAFRVDAEK